MNRLIHYLLHESSNEAADEVSKFFVGPLLDFHRRLLAEGFAAGEFRTIDPVLFYTSLIGACDNLFFSRHAMSRAIGVGPVTDEVCRDYVAHMEAMLLGGMLTTTQFPPRLARGSMRFKNKKKPQRPETSRKLQS